MWLATSALSALAQAPYYPSNNAPLRPVPRALIQSHAAVNSQPSTRTNVAQTQSGQPDWNLKWRRSGKAPTRPPARGRTHVAATTNQLQVASEKPNLRSIDGPPSHPNQVAPTNWLAQPQRSDLFASDSDVQLTQAQRGQSRSNPSQPGRASEPNFFDDPFGDETSNSGKPSAPSDSPQEEMLFPPAPAADSTPPRSGPRPMNDLRSAFDELEAPVPDDVTSDDSAMPIPAPRREAAEEMQSDEPSLGDMLRESQPDVSPRSEAEEPLPMPDRDESADPFSDNQFENPFERRGDRTNRDRQDSDESSEDKDRREFEGRYEANDEESPNPGVLSCEDFRKRIKEQTIEQVSLDISPPYRPDEIDIKRYEKLKAEFDEKQEIRQWRSIDGRALATGRLLDLAYEKAVIETEYGTKEELPFQGLSEGDIAYITENWGLPQECLIEQVAFTPRTWAQTTMTWKASNLCHKPLYFEDVNLERYGHTRGPVLEPIFQSAHFVANIAVLPYKMGIHGPDECQYALGYYRPGNCAPWITPAVPLSARGAIAQAATMTGLFWLIP